ncbi:uncharacterized protein LOC133184963 [Saccostrea echinata]|uniref:uncharacterized protein LOC133184963 n=1 Tax=Saccostrea echinata TaxID=191078 RepID=UPI002A83547D|nr:uncharacterized protein LOC133184963 [Saccostrea echinata]
MDFQRWCTWFLAVVGLFALLPSLYEGVQWLMIRTNIEETDQRSKPNPAPNSKESVRIPTAKVNETKREQRLQRDFLSTAPSKRLINTRTEERTAITEAVRENIKLMERDLIITESSLLDELQIADYLTEEEVKMMKNRSRKDQTHLFAERIELLDNKAFLGVLKVLDKSSFGHIAKGLEESYVKHLPSKSRITLCPVCRIRSEVDIKELRCDLKEQGFLPSTLYSDINNCQADKNHQNALWEALFFHLRQLQPNEDVLKIFINFFNTSKHEGLYHYLKQNPPFRYVCTCHSAKSSFEIDSMKLKALSTDSSDESNTSSVKTYQEPEFYLDAVNTSSSESGSKIIYKRSRKIPRMPAVSKNKHCNRGTKRGYLTGPNYENKGKGPQQKNSMDVEVSLHLNKSGGSTVSLDSNPGSNVLNFSKVPPKKIWEKETESKDTISEAMNSVSSDTEVKTINETVHTHYKGPTVSSIESIGVLTFSTEVKTIGHRDISCKKKPVVSVRPYITESDVNSDGEARKIYTFPAEPLFKKFPRDSEFAKENVPTAFAKTVKSKGSSEIW